MKKARLKLRFKTTLLCLLFVIPGSLSSLAQTYSWIQKSDLGYNVPNVAEPSARSGAVSFSIGSKGYLGTGSDNYTLFKDFWEYDPGLNVWTQKADFGGSERKNAVGFSIDGKGYVGTGATPIAQGAKDFWEYDPALNLWTQKADFAGTPRYGAVGFSIGSKGYIGTGGRIDYYWTFYKDFWEYNPATDSWTKKADFGGTVREYAAGFATANKGYIGTGYWIDFNLNSYWYKDFWEYDPATNTWMKKADFGGGGRNSAVGVAIGSKGYIGTGFTESLFNDENDFWEYDPDLDTWTQKADIGGGIRENCTVFSISGKGYLGMGRLYLSYCYKDLWEYDPDLNSWQMKTYNYLGRESAVGFSIGDKGYIGTGINSTIYPNTFFSDFWEYDAQVNAWTQKADFGGGPRSGAVGFSIGDKGYAGTGSYGNFNNDFWEYDPILNVWTKKSDFGGTARADAMCFSLGAKGYVGTGANAGQQEKDFWEYDPVLDVWIQKADLLNRRTGAVGFSIGSKGYLCAGAKNYTLKRDLWEYDPNFDTWTQREDFGGGERTNMVGFSIGNKGYAGTGSSPVECSDFWEYNPDLNTWTPQADFAGDSRTAAIGFSIGNKGYVGTGSHDGFNYNDFWEFTSEPVGISPVEDFGSTLSVFPNPASDVFILQLTLRYETSTDAKIEIFNSLGQLIHSQIAAMIRGKLRKEIHQGHSMREGMYHVKVIVDDRVYSAQISFQK